MDTTTEQRADLRMSLSAVLNIDRYAAHELARYIQAEWHQVNDFTAIQPTSARRITVVYGVPINPKPTLKTRRVRKKGYRWQFHRAFYELMDLPFYVEWGWETEQYEDWNDITLPPRRELEMKMVGMDRRYADRYVPMGEFTARFRAAFAYDPERDTLYVNQF